MKRRPWALFAASLTSLVLAPAARAQPAAKPATDDQDKVNLQCEADYEDAQRAQNADHLLEAKDKYTRCGAESCPKSVRNECAKVLPDLATSIPTAVFDAVDGDGSQVVATHVFVDGKEVQSSIDGHTVQIDPGPHKVRFESAGKKPVEIDVAMLSGQQHRTVQGRFAGGSSDEGGARPFGIIPWIVAGSGLAVLGAGIGVLVPGEINIGKASDQCPGRKCTTQAAVDLGNQGIAMATAGKVLVPIGATALGAGLVWQLLFNGKRQAPAVGKKQAPAVSVDAGPRGAFVSATARF